MNLLEVIKSVPNNAIAKLYQMPSSKKGDIHKQEFEEFMKVNFPDRDDDDYDYSKEHMAKFVENDKLRVIDFVQDIVKNQPIDANKKKRIMNKFREIYVSLTRHVTVMNQSVRFKKETSDNLSLEGNSAKNKDIEKEHQYPPANQSNVDQSSSTNVEVDKGRKSVTGKVSDNRSTLIGVNNIQTNPPDMIGENLQDNRKLSAKSTESESKHEGNDMSEDIVGRLLSTTKDPQERGKYIVYGVIYSAWYPTKDKSVMFRSKMKNTVAGNEEDEEDDNEVKPAKQSKSSKKEPTIAQNDMRRYQADEISDVIDDSSKKWSWLVPVITGVGALILGMLLARGSGSKSLDKSTQSNATNNQSNQQPSANSQINEQSNANQASSNQQNNESTDISDYSKNLFNRVKAQEELDEFGNPILTASQMSSHLR